MNKDGITEEDFGFSKRVLVPEFEIVENIKIKLSELGKLGEALKEKVNRLGESEVNRLLNKGV